MVFAFSSQTRVTGLDGFPSGEYAMTFRLYKRQYERFHYLDIVLLAEIDQGIVCEVRMDLNLVHNGFDCAVVQNALQLEDVEIGNTDRLDFSCLDELLHRLVGIKIVGIADQMWFLSVSLGNGRNVTTQLILPGQAGFDSSRSAGPSSGPTKCIGQCIR